MICFLKWIYIFLYFNSTELKDFYVPFPFNYKILNDYNNEIIKNIKPYKIDNLDRIENNNINKTFIITKYLTDRDKNNNDASDISSVSSYDSEDEFILPRNENNNILSSSQNNNENSSQMSFGNSQVSDILDESQYCNYSSDNVSDHSSDHITEELKKKLKRPRVSNILDIDLEDEKGNIIKRKDDDISSVDEISSEGETDEDKPVKKYV